MEAGEQEFGDSSVTQSDDDDSSDDDDDDDEEEEEDEEEGSGSEDCAADAATKDKDGGDAPMEGPVTVAAQVQPELQAGSSSGEEESESESESEPDSEESEDGSRDGVRPELAGVRLPEPEGAIHLDVKAEPKGGGSRVGPIYVGMKGTWCCRDRSRSRNRAVADGPDARSRSR
jgi:hypothetical protein